jgi:dipeptidase E
VRLYLSSFRVGNEPEALLELLGNGRRTALIVNADDYKSAGDRAVSLRRELDELTGIGLDPTEVDLRDYFDAPGELATRLAGFDLIYVRGGNVFVLRRAFRQSRADDIITELLANDRVVYAGYSAGPCVLTPSLRAFEGGIDDPMLIPDGYADTPPIWEGLNIIPFGIVPHYHSDHPETAEADQAVEWFIHNHIPFIALRDGEAIVLNKGYRTIMGVPTTPRQH